MAELTLRERKQPCLLDRLTDDDPGSTQEGRDKRVMSMSQIRRSVLRDLEWLFNTSARWSEEDLRDFPQVYSSVINYGVPDLCGLTSSSVNPIEIERAVERSIRNFEPRILSNTLSVIADADEDQVGTNAVRFEIRGMLWAQPLPEQMYVKTDVDLETGACKVQESPYG